MPLKAVSFTCCIGTKSYTRKVIAILFGSYTVFFRIDLPYLRVWVVQFCLLCLNWGCVVAIDRFYREETPFILSWPVWILQILFTWTISAVSFLRQLLSSASFSLRAASVRLYALQPLFRLPLYALLCALDLLCFGGGLGYFFA